MKPILALGAILTSAALITAGPAHAQTKEQKAGARAAAEAGADAYDAGRYADAADLFERAERLLHAPPHLLYAARAHAKLGHLVEARELYLALTRESLPANAPRPFREAQQQGEKELAAIEPRLAYASVVVQGGAGARNVRVTRNGEPLPGELLGLPAPINPGEYSFQAFADGMESTLTNITFREGVRETIVLTLRDLPEAKTKPAAVDASNAAGSTYAVTPSDASPGRPLLIGSIVGFGVAAAGGAIGTVFLLKGISKQDEADAAFRRDCPGGSCSPEIYKKEAGPLDDDAAAKKNIALASYITGGVGLITGVTLLILDQNRQSSGIGKTTVTPVVGLGYAGVAGRF